MAESNWGVGVDLTTRKECLTGNVGDQATKARAMSLEGGVLGHSWVLIGFTFALVLIFGV